MSEQRAKVTWGMAAQIAAWLIGVLLAYGTISARVAVLESRVNGTDARMERIENKLDRVLDRLPK